MYLPDSGLLCSCFSRKVRLHNIRFGKAAYRLTLKRDYHLPLLYSFSVACTVAPTDGTRRRMLAFSFHRAPLSLGRESIFTTAPVDSMSAPLRDIRERQSLTDDVES